ncbi:MAG: flagellar motor switch phosphatase FliY [Lachnospiraceae bacterium]|jgi:flagellar motor switch protein FliN/FliY|nr:flagellar motor switch phosphatase FliY [Lachnospiraceae bacterium]MCI8986043.1 flagellar motor switch phosphatase FliY [Lachnospiraceae bacterium]
MDGMLSQDEINALLSGMDEPGSESAPEDAAAAQPDSASAGSDLDESVLTAMEKDAIGEVANISMGSSATTLSSLVNRRVNITTPVVTLARWENVLRDYEKPCVFIQIKYTVGLDGSNILVLKEHDVKVITDLMMGGDGSNVEGELGELHLSAISEAMNQMMGSSATSLSTMLDKMIDISPPEASFVDLSTFKSGGDIAPFLADIFVKIAFRMQIDDLVDSTIMQLYPIDFAKELCDTFLKNQLSDTASEPAPQAAAPQGGMAPQMDMNQMGMPQMGMPQMQMGMGMPQMGMDMNQMGMPQMQMGMGMPQMQAQMGMPQMQPGMGMPQMQMMPNMNIQPAQFQSFSRDTGAMPGQETIGLIKDVPLEVTVELGRTSKSIAEILDFTPGTIIELDKIAGEPIDILVNGRLVARGEVVVIEESFGVRVTEIIK